MIQATPSLLELERCEHLFTKISPHTFNNFLRINPCRIIELKLLNHIASLVLRKVAGIVRLRGSGGQRVLSSSVSCCGAPKSVWLLVRVLSS